MSSVKAIPGQRFFRLVNRYVRESLNYRLTISPAVKADLAGLITEAHLKNLVSQALLAARLKDFSAQELLSEAALQVTRAELVEWTDEDAENPGRSVTIRKLKSVEVTISTENHTQQLVLPLSVQAEMKSIPVS